VVTKVQVYSALPRRDPETMLPLRAWDYVCEQDNGQVVRVGYCAGWVDWNEEQALIDYGLAFLEHAKKEFEHTLPFKAKYHSEGHPTMVEAEDCFREFLLDQHLVFVTKPMDPAYRQCEVAGCGKLTRLYATMSPASHLIHLCAEHHNRSGVELVFPPGSIRRIVSSY
jgi:hypothetical protein